MLTLDKLNSILFCSPKINYPLPSFLIQISVQTNLNLLVEDLICFTLFQIATTLLSRSCKSSLTTKLIMWAQQLKYMNSPPKTNASFPCKLNASYNFLRAKLLAVALSTVIVKIFFIPHSTIHTRRTSHMVWPLWYEMCLKPIIIFLRCQLASTKCVVVTM